MSVSGNVRFYCAHLDEFGVLCVEPVDDEYLATSEDVAAAVGYYPDAIYFSVEKADPFEVVHIPSRYCDQPDVWEVVRTADSVIVARLHGGRDAERLIRKVCAALNDGWKEE